MKLNQIEENYENTSTNGQRDVRAVSSNYGKQQFQTMSEASVSTL
jgi:hypothetical protein